MSSNAASTSKYAMVTAAGSSLLDLKAELSKQEDNFSKTRHLGSTTKPTKIAKKSTIFSKQNRGLRARMEKDQLAKLDVVQRSDPKVISAALERKARLYDKIRRGRIAGLDENQLENIMVDFEGKSSGEESEEEEEDFDESTTVPQRLIDDSNDPYVEFTDDFGRTRSVKRSELPSEAIVPVEFDAEPINDSNVIYGDQVQFPVYAPDPELLRARAIAFAASNQPTLNHYNSSLENRTKAAGAYNFSQDETVRAEQMAALKRERDITIGEREGGSGKGKLIDDREREKEDRKRKVLEKRKEMELKRQKIPM